MKKKNMKEYMEVQIHEIEIHKWIESEKANRDMGEEAVKDWILKHAKKFREEWNEKHENNEDTEDL